MNVSEQLTNRLPPEYRSPDRVLEVLLESVSPKLQEVSDSIDALGTNFDPMTTPDGWLDFLLERIGWPVDSGMTSWQKREVLKSVGRWRRNYGKVGIIPEIIRLYFRPGPSSLGLGIALNARKSIKGGFRIAKGRIGRGRVFQRFSRNEILVSITDFGDVPNNQATRQRLERFLDELVPPWMLYRVVN